MKLRDVKLHPRNFLLAAALLTAAPLCLTGCINDDEPWGEEEKFELTEGTEYYIGVNINVPSGTDLGAQESRAETYVGEFTESKITSMLFLFYNKNGALVGASKVSVPTKTPGQTYRLTVPVKVLPAHAVDDATPVQIVAIANPPFNYDKFLVSMKSLTDIKLKLSEVATSSMAGPQYMMSSSVYYEDGKAMFATKVTRSDFHTMQADADASANPIEIDLERIVARVDTRFRSNWESSVASNGIFYWNEASGVNDNARSARLGLTLVSWDISAQDKEAYLIKNFRVDDFSNAFMTIAQANAAFDGLTDPAWNNADERRSYWACSPGYYNSMSQTEYFSATELKSRISLSNSVQGNPLSLCYFLESTRCERVLEREGIAGVPSVTVLGQYQVGGDTKVGEINPSAPTFYLRRYSQRHASTKNFYYESDEQLIKAFLAANDDYLYTVNVGNAGIGWSDIKRDFYYRDQLFEIVRSSSTGYMMLQLKSDCKPEDARFCLRVDHTGDNSQDFVYVVSNPSSTSGRKEISIIQANRLIAEYYAATDMRNVEKFTNGLTYFTIPIKHLWQGTSNIEDEDYQPKVGQYGLVRNHLYTIEITGVYGIGHSIADPDETIRPSLWDPNTARSGEAQPRTGVLTSTVTAKSL